MEVILQVDENNQAPKIIVSTPQKAPYFESLVSSIRRLLCEGRLQEIT